MNENAVSLIAAIAASLSAHATAVGQTQQLPPPSSAGSADVLIDGKPAQRAGDQHGETAAPPEGSPDVLINGNPAMTGGGCPAGSVPITSPNVFINGKPAVIGCSK